jgi:hypothetical protein
MASLRRHHPREVTIDLDRALPKSINQKMLLGNKVTIRESSACIFCLGLVMCNKREHNGAMEANRDSYPLNPYLEDEEALYDGTQNSHPGVVYHSDCAS